MGSLKIWIIKIKDQIQMSLFVGNISKSVKKSELEEAF